MAASMVPWRKASVWCLFAPCLCCRSAYVSAFYLCRKEAHHLPAWMPSWILQLHQAVAKGVHLEVVAEDISNPTVYNNLTACRSIFRRQGKADLPLRCGDRYTSTTGVTSPRIRCSRVLYMYMVRCFKWSDALKSSLVSSPCYTVFIILNTGLFNSI